MFAKLDAVLAAQAVQSNRLLDLTAAMVQCFVVLTCIFWIYGFATEEPAQQGVHECKAVEINQFSWY